MMKNHATSAYQTYFMLPGSCQMEGIIGLYNYIMLYLVGILFFVTAALLLIINDHLDGNRYNQVFDSEDNKESIKWLRYVKSWTHSTILELVWTIIPTIILIAIAVPSFILLYALDEIVDTQCVVKIIGYQWYWRFEYPITLDEELDVLNVYYYSYMKPYDELTEEWPLRLLEVDMPLILPQGVNIKLIITAKDVLHSFAIPSLGIKMDAVPGRLNQVTVFIFKSGIYYGQCSELCGVNHAFMPIVLHVISYDIFQNFLFKISFVSIKDKILNILNDRCDVLSMTTFIDENSADSVLKSSNKKIDSSEELDKDVKISDFVYEHDPELVAVIMEYLSRSAWAEAYLREFYWIHNIPTDSLEEFFKKK